MALVPAEEADGAAAWEAVGAVPCEAAGGCWEAA